MYISYLNHFQEVVTLNSDNITDKNITELENRKEYLDYLFYEATYLLGTGDISNRYQTIYIPKKNNTTRRIDIPDEELIEYQKKLVTIFSEKLSFLFPKSVYGYVRGKNTKAMADKHKNQFLIIKMDIKNFFPSCTLDFIMDSMSKVYPFCLLEKDYLQTILLPCMVFYDGKYRLPQGAPSSPILSNISMVPIDCSFGYFAPEYKLIYNYTYTRFADDIIVSFSNLEKTKYSISKIVNEITFFITQCLSPYFTINQEKTKVLNTDCGNVWMLGISVGKDIGFGNKRKQKLKASVWTFLNDCKNGKTWSSKEVQQLLGILAYARYLEPNFVDALIAKYEAKTNLSFKKEVKKIL